MLQEISDGLYCFKEVKNSKGLNNIRPLVIGVHPFYYQKHDWEEKIDYALNVEKLILAHDGPVMVLEEWPSIEDTAEEIKRFGRTEGLYFVKSWENSPEPAELYWKELLGFIDQMSNGKIKLFGGEYVPNITDSVAASFRRYVSEQEGLKALLKKPIEKVATHACCLGYFEAVLRCYNKHDVEVIEELTFS